MYGRMRLPGLAMILFWICDATAAEKNYDVTTSLMGRSSAKWPSRAPYRSFYGIFPLHTSHRT